MAGSGRGRSILDKNCRANDGGPKIRSTARNKGALILGVEGKALQKEMCLGKGGNGSNFTSKTR